MQPRTEAALRQLDLRRRELRAAIDAAPAAMRARRPAPDRWSVDLIVEHLATVEAGLMRLLGSRLRALKPTADAVPAVATQLDAGRVLDRTQRIVAGTNVQPRGEVDAEASWRALTQSRTGLQDVVRAADGRDVSALVVPHPAFGPLDFWQWIDFIGLHEARHAAQIREVVAALAAG
jgi:hypothetical protein